MRERLSLKDNARLDEARSWHLNGEFLAAQSTYESLMKKYPGNGVVQGLLGALFVDSGAPKQAIPVLQRATRHNKKDANAHYNLGLAFAEIDKHAEAIGAYKRAIAADPKHTKAYYNLGFSYRRCDRLAEAVKAFERDFAIAPASDTCRLLTRTFMELEKFDRALFYANRCVELEGARPEDLNLLIVLICRQMALAPAISTQEAEELIALADHATTLTPNSVPALVNQGRAYSQLGRFEAALPPLQAALQLEPEHDTAHSLYGIALLTEGKLFEGWHERTVLERMRKMVTPTGVSRWQGQLQSGYKLWVTREQGVGDQILYARMLQDLVAAGVDVTLVCEKRIHPLFERSFPEVTLSTGLDEDAQKLQDGFATLGELHLTLRKDLAAIPAPENYLLPDADLKEKFRARYANAYPGKTITGIAWRSHSEVNGAGKSVPLDELLPVLQSPDRVFVCVQYGEGWDELQAHAEKHGYLVHYDEDADSLASLEDGAAQLAALDELVSVSNASVHMAGAMGVACHVLVGQRPVWHWFSENTAPDALSPWYTNVRLYRQQSLSDWHAPIAQIAEQLT